MDEFKKMKFGGKYVDCGPEELISF